MSQTSVNASPPEKARKSSHEIHAAHTGKAGGAALAIAALGVVFGDLGTSPLYTLQECFSGPHGVPPTDANVMGVLSLVFWSLTMVVTVKYMMFLMRADNGGEGGIMALLALAPEKLRSPGNGRVGFVAFLVITGSALLFGDGIITPAVSVLSAIEGLGIATEKLKEAVIPITVVILIGLFAIQSRGTASLGRLFGPVMLLWFITIAALGGWHVAHHLEILRALSPAYAIQYFREHGLHGITILGGVVLCVTGGEALYADMGHFGPAPIKKAWLWVCIPSLVLAYFGQGAILVAEANPTVRAAIGERPFYSMCPQGVWLYPFVGIAALGTIIASQALISGVFSLTYQAIQLGYFPRLTVEHTSDEAEGQIYLPLMNWGLAGACIALVLVFRESGKLAAAFGLAVSGTMAITSVAYFVVLRHTWKWPLWKAGGLMLLFLSFDIPFVIANFMKFFDGGYLPFGVGVVFVIIMVNWRIGRSLLGAHFRRLAEPLDQFIDTIHERVDARIPGVVVFMASAGGVPPSMRRLVARFRSLQQTVVLLTVVLEHVPRVAEEDRIQDASELKNGFHRLALHYGFIEKPNIPSHLAQALPSLGIDVQPNELVYVLGRETFIASNKGEMGAISEGLFAFMSRNAKSATDYFGIEPDQVIEIGAQINL